MSQKRINQFDKMVESFASEFSKIPDFGKKMQEKDYNEAHTYVSASIISIRTISDLVIHSFVPAVDNKIAETKREINASKYKSILSQIAYDVNNAKYETIRQGYVMVFHKYEVFLKGLFSLYDKLLPPDDPMNTLEKYCKKTYQFEPKAWHLYPVIHRVQFVANCTKHAGGKCRLDNPNHDKPFEYLEYSDEDMLDLPLINFKEDVTALMESIPLLINIINSCTMARLVQDQLADFISDRADNEFIIQLSGHRTALDLVILAKISAYKHCIG